MKIHPEGIFRGTVTDIYERLPEDGRQGYARFRIRTNRGILFWYVGENSVISQSILAHVLRNLRMRNWRNLCGKKVRVTVKHCSFPQHTDNVIIVDVKGLRI